MKDKKQLIIELSGQTGLSANFFGFSDRVSPNPELILAKSTEDIVSGIFNQHVREGYLFPSFTSSTSVTLDTSSATQLGSVEYDFDNGLVYWGNTVDSLYVGTGLSDTSLLLEGTLDFTTGTPEKFYNLSDLQVYQINGVPKLFYTGAGTVVHSSISTSEYPTVSLATVPTSNDSAFAAISIKPSSTTQPAIVANTRDFNAASSATHTVSFTVPSGSNQALTVVAFSSGGQNVTGITWNGVAMSSVSGTTSASSGVSVYRTYAPAVGTFNIVVTYSAATTNRLLYAIVTNNTDQTNGIRATSEAQITGTTIIPKKRIISNNQITLYAAYSDEVMTFTAPKTTQIYNTTNTYGSDGLFVEYVSGLYLQIGIADLPLTTVTQAQASWISGSALDGDLSVIYGGYALLRTSDNGFMYAFADNKVHKIDGTITGGVNGSITKDVIVFPEAFRIADAIDYRSYIYMAINEYNSNIHSTNLNNYSTNCGIYIWNRQSTQYNNSDYMRIPGVREIKKIYVSPTGGLMMITISDRGLTQLRELSSKDGSSFTVVKTLGIGAYPQYHDGLTSVGNNVVWVANDGNVYCERDGFINILHQVKAPSTTESTLATNISTGAIFFGSGSETASSGYRSNKQPLTFSYLDGGTHYIKKIYPFDLTLGDNSAQYPNQGNVYTGVHVLPQLSNVGDVIIRCIPTASGATQTATVKYYFNGSATPAITKAVTLNHTAKGYISHAINMQYVNSIQIEIEWATGVAIGPNTFAPYLATVTYEPTDTYTRSDA